MILYTPKNKRQPVDLVVLIRDGNRTIIEYRSVYIGKKRVEMSPFMFYGFCENTLSTRLESSRVEYQLPPQQIIDGDLFDMEPKAIIFISYTDDGKISGLFLSNTTNEGGIYTGTSVENVIKQILFEKTEQVSNIDVPTRIEMMNKWLKQFSDTVPIFIDTSLKETQALSLAGNPDMIPMYMDVYEVSLLRQMLADESNIVYFDLSKSAPGRKKYHLESHNLKKNISKYYSELCEVQQEIYKWVLRLNSEKQNQ